MRFLLKDDGFKTYKKIVTGRKCIGRVCRCADGSFLGIIGKTQYRGSVEAVVFDEVVARHLGYDSVDALKDRNRRVAAANRARSEQIRRDVDALTGGDLRALENLLCR